MNTIQKIDNFLNEQNNDFEWVYNQAHLNENTLTDAVKAFFLSLGEEPTSDDFGAGGMDQIPQQYADEIQSSRYNETFEKIYQKAHMREGGHRVHIPDDIRDSYVKAVTNIKDPEKRQAEWDKTLDTIKDHNAKEAAKVANKDAVSATQVVDPNANRKKESLQFERIYNAARRDRLLLESFKWSPEVVKYLQGSYALRESNKLQKLFEANALANLKGLLQKAFGGNKQAQQKAEQLAVQISKSQDKEAAQTFAQKLKSMIPGGAVKVAAIAALILTLQGIAGPMAAYAKDNVGNNAGSTLSTQINLEDNPELLGKVKADLDAKRLKLIQQAQGGNGNGTTDFKQDGVVGQDDLEYANKTGELTNDMIIEYMQVAEKASKPYKFAKNNTGSYAWQSIAAAKTSIMNAMKNYGYKPAETVDFWEKLKANPDVAAQVRRSF